MRKKRCFNTNCVHPVKRFYCSSSFWYGRCFLTSSHLSHSAGFNVRVPFKRSLTYVQRRHASPRVMQQLAPAPLFISSLLLSRSGPRKWAFVRREAVSRGLKVSSVQSRECERHGASYHLRAPQREGNDTKWPPCIFLLIDTTLRWYSRTPPIRLNYKLPREYLPLCFCLYTYF